MGSASPPASRSAARSSSRTRRSRSRTTRFPANRVDQEIARLDFAVDEVQKELTTLHGTMMRDGELPGEFGAFLDVHWMILNDPTLAEAPKRIIAEQRCNAEWALVQQMNVLIDQFDQIEDAYLRERKNDVVQVVERVLKRLMGKPGSLPTRSPRSARSSSRTTSRPPT
jgi:phosphotransferase system enzyme I (PtsI)